MRMLFAFMLFSLLCGCESLGEVIREKKYNIQLHETPNSKQTFGYNDDYDYVGFMISGKFGKADPPHQHSINCEHNSVE